MTVRFDSPLGAQPQEAPWSITSAPPTELDDQRRAEIVQEVNDLQRTSENHLAVTGKYREMNVADELYHNDEEFLATGQSNLKSQLVRKIIDSKVPQIVNMVMGGKPAVTFIANVQIAPGKDRKIEALIDKRFDQCKAMQRFVAFPVQQLCHGVAYMLAYWDPLRRRSCFEVLDNWNAFPDPEGGFDIENAQWFIRRTFIGQRDLKELIAKGYYPEINDQDLGDWWSAPDSRRTHPSDAERGRNEVRMDRRRIPVLECWTPEEVLTLIGTGGSAKLASVRPNPTYNEALGWRGLIPVSMATDRESLRGWMGHGEPYVVRGEAKVSTLLINAMTETVKRTAFPTMMLDSTIDPTKFRLKPMGTVIVHNLMGMPNHPIQPVQMPPMSRDAMELLSKYEEQAKSNANTTPWTTGDDPKRKEHVRTALLLAERADQPNVMVGNKAGLALAQTGKHMWALEMAFMQEAQTVRTMRGQLGIGGHMSIAPLDIFVESGVESMDVGVQTAAGGGMRRQEYEALIELATFLSRPPSGDIYQDAILNVMAVQKADIDPRDKERLRKYYESQFRQAQQGAAQPAGAASPAMPPGLPPGMPMGAPA